MQNVLPNTFAESLLNRTENPSTNSARFPDNLAHKLEIALDQLSRPIAICRDKSNPYVLHVGSKALNSVIRSEAEDAGQKLTKNSLSEINDSLAAFAEKRGVVKPTWCRVAPVTGGIEIDLGDEAHTRVRVLKGEVAEIFTGSDELFVRPAHSRLMAAPGAVGDVELLRKYVNLDDTSYILFRAWLSYTLAHPKVSSSKYVILSVFGGQGSGKSFFSKVIKDIVDPSCIGVQAIPVSTKDLAIATQNSHVLCFDNLRAISHAMSDALCIASTGGSIACRQLYSDGGQHVIPLHGALVLNGIHHFVSQPDLAQRCLPLHLVPFAGACRKSEVELQQGLDADMPEIQRGLLECIASIFSNLARAQVIHPERMLDFCTWLAAMELVDEVPPGLYQKAYSDRLNQGQLDTLLDSSLGAAIVDFCTSLGGDKWEGTPTQLLGTLDDRASMNVYRGSNRFDCPIKLSKRLQSMQASLKTQGIDVSWCRGKERKITIFNESYY